MRTVDDKVVVALHQIRDAIKNKECCNGGGGSSDSSSKEITIDDVVKFIHDNWSSPGFNFPYTTWDSIPNEADVDDGICKSRSFIGSSNTMSILTIINGEESYRIGLKQRSIG